MLITTEKLIIFQDLVSCVHNIQLTEFDARTFEPLTNSSPVAPVLYFLFSLDSGASPWWTPNGPNFDALQTAGSFRPVVSTNSLDMVWISEIEQSDGKPYRIHVFGPVFVSDISMQSILSMLDQRSLSLTVREKVMDFIHEIPVVSTIRFYEYGLMLHWCLTGERITISDFMYIDSGNKSGETGGDLPHSSHGTYFNEQRMLQSVREGNLQYREQTDHLASVGYTGQIIAKDNLRQAKNYVIIYTALCCRAAVQGGLDIEVAYTLSDQYLDSIEASDNLSALHEISKAMVRDYVERVHRVKVKDGISPKIQSACEWISLYPQSQSIHSLAEKLGYTDYYFSRLFKKETGFTVQEYILDKKIEHGKQLLISSSLSIAEISEQLGIESASYFTACFRDATGMTPSEYRSAHG